jgi:hypothetical protein
MELAQGQHKSATEALAHAIMTEIDREGENPLHKTISISFRTLLMDNGMKQCSVQVECKAGCGYLIEAFGEEAEVLEHNAVLFKNILANGEADPDVIGTYLISQ